MHKVIRKAKKGKCGLQEVITRKQEYRDACKRKKDKEKNELESEIGEIKTEADTWKVINKRKKRRSNQLIGITLEGWTSHLRNLLEGTDEDPIEKHLLEQRTQPTEREEISRELEKAIGKLKKKKAPGRWY